MKNGTLFTQPREKLTQISGFPMPFCFQVRSQYGIDEQTNWITDWQDYLCYWSEWTHKELSYVTKLLLGNSTTVKKESDVIKLVNMQFSSLNEIQSQLTAYTGQSVHAVS